MRLVAERTSLQFVNYEVRAGLSSDYEQKDWVADDIHSESASRTLDYACKYHEELASGVILSISRRRLRRLRASRPTQQDGRGSIFPRTCDEKPLFYF